MLSIAQPIPDFTGEALLPDGSFAPITLSDYRGKWLVLFFYPLDFTFVCPTEIQAFNRLHDAFQKVNATVIGISIDSVHTHLAWTRHGLGKLQFPLLSDLSHALSTACGVLSPEGYAERATYIVNPEGKIESVTVVSANVGRSAEETLRLVQALQTGGLAPCGWHPGDKLIEAA